jgi:hypothetical protein
MDSKQCTIQCLNCQPIHCPINQQGLYLLPTHNTIDVNEYIDKTNHERYIAAAEELSELAALTKDDDANEYNLSEPATNEAINQARFAVAATAISEQAYNDDGDERSVSELYKQRDEPPIQTTRDDDEESENDTSEHTSHWASPNRFAALAAAADEESEEPHRSPTPRRNNFSRQE